MTTNQSKIWNGYSTTFSIIIGKSEELKVLIDKANYTKITQEAYDLVNSLVNNETIKEQIMDVELVEFTNHPNEDDVQQAFKERELLFPTHLDALRFGAKYHEMGSLLNKSLRCCVMFPYEIFSNTRETKKMLAVSYGGTNKTLCIGGLGTQWDERWYFAGLRPHQKE